MTRLWIARALLALLVLLLFGASDSALGLCDKPQPRLVRAEYSQSDAVVIAHLLRSQHIDPKDARTIDYYLYTFQVEKVLRGSIPRQFVLWNENSSGRLTFDVLRGRKYLLFVDRWANKGWWTADGCGNSGEASKSANIIGEIQRISSLRDALITGNIETATPAMHAKVLAVRESDTKQFQAQARDDGTFALNVPPGKYSVKATAEGKNFVSNWFSYENAKSVKLIRGGCAQIQFVPSDSTDAER